MTGRIDASEISERIREIVGPQGLIADPQAQARYLIDERRQYHGRAAAIVQPASAAEISRLMAYCHAAGIGMVPQGGNTGYCGGATPDTSGTQVLISLARLSRIRTVDPVAYTMTLEAGVILAEAQRAAGAAGMLLPLSMGSEGSCQIGGNLSTNAGGLAVLRYGTARESVLGLEVVLPDGRLWDGLTALRKDNTGYDLKQLFLGAEGTLGVITAAVLKLFPAPAVRETAWIAVRDLHGACDLLGVTRRLLGDCVTSFEYISRASLDLVLSQVAGTREPFGDERHAHQVLLEVSGSALTGDLRHGLLQVFETAERAGLAQDAVVAESGEQRRALWELREKIPAGERLAGGSIKHDVALPIADLSRFTAEAGAQVAAQFPGARLSVYGHIGDGNLHFNVLAAATDDPVAFKVQHGTAVSAIVHGLAARQGGSFSAEHGVGQLKRDLLAATESAVALDLMHRLKDALDPKGLMNPGKVL